MTHNAEITQRSMSETYAKEGLFIKALPGQAVSSKPCYTLKKEKKKGKATISVERPCKIPRVRCHEAWHPIVFKNTHLQRLNISQTT